MSVVPIHQPEPGWVYVAASPAIPNMVKVGRTSRSPIERIAEFFDTDQPHPLHLVHAFPVDDTHGAERRAHAALSRWRVRTDREWFAVDAPRAVRVLSPVFGQRDRRAWRIVRGIVEAWGWINIAVLIAASVFAS